MSIKTPLVSIITPCYNGDKTVHRMVESVLAQTYDNIEYILVNDGSTDNTEKVVLSYKEKFEERGYRFIYVKQENGGLSAAINAGLKKFTGDYLCWADADDFYAPESVEKRVSWMENNPEYGVVTSDAYIVSESDLSRTDRKVSQGVTDNEDENQFWHLLVGNSIFCCACHMIRSADFLKINPERRIYSARRGQNWQMLLPMYYHYKRHFLAEPLYYYVTSDNTMSKDTTVQQKIDRCEEHENNISHVLDEITMTTEDRIKAKKTVKVLYAEKRLSIAFRAGLPDLAKQQVVILKEEKKYSIRNRCYFLGAKYPLFRKIFG